MALVEITSKEKLERSIKLICRQSDEDLRIAAQSLDDYCVKIGQANLMRLALLVAQEDEERAKLGEIERTRQNCLRKGEKIRKNRRAIIEISFDQTNSLYTTRIFQNGVLINSYQCKKYDRFNIVPSLENKFEQPRVPWKKIELGEVFKFEATLGWPYWKWDHPADRVDKVVALHSKKPS